jgi:ribosomal 50S subunit-recycling heat shock protein
LRLDKFLKVSRIIKRRSVAAEACGGERVYVNGKPARASYAVKPGDILEVRFGAKTFKAEVADVREHAGKDEAALMYREL